MPFNAQDLDNHLKAVQKRYPNTVGRDIDRHPARISTGSISLDYITGGGIPIGHNTMFWGGFGSGKTLTAWGVIAEAQKMWPDEPMAYYNMEKQYHPAFAEAHGVDTSPERLIVIDGNIIEGVGTVMQTLIGSVRLHVVDSISEGIAMNAMEREIEATEQPGTAAKAWKNVLLHVRPLMNPENTMVWISQGRELIGSSTKYVQRYPMGGKYMADFLPDLRIEFNKGTKLFYNDNGVLEDKNKDNSAQTFSGLAEPDGIQLKAYIDKTRICKPFRRCDMYLDTNLYTFDKLYELRKVASEFDLIEKSGAWYTLPSGERCHGEPALRKAMAEDPEFQELVRTTMMKALEEE